MRVQTWDIAGTVSKRRFLFSALMVVWVAGAVAVGVSVGRSPLWALLVLGVVGEAIFVFRPVWGLYLLIPLIFAEEFVVVGPSLTVTKIVGLGVMVAWGVHAVVMRDRPVFPRHAWLWAGFVGWGTVSLIWAKSLPPALEAATTLLQLLGLYVLVVNLVTDRTRLDVIVVLIITSATLWAVVAIDNYFAGRGWTSPGYLRARANDLQDPNFFAASLLPAVVLVLSRMANSRLRPWQAAWFVAFAIILSAILLTQSRGTYLALASAILFILLRHRLSFLYIASAALILIAGGALPLDRITERALSIISLSEGGASRPNIWLVGVSIFRAYPLAGIGLGNFSVGFDSFYAQAKGLTMSLHRGYGAHSIYVSTLAELGLVGIVLMAGALVSAFISHWLSLAQLKRLGSPAFATSYGIMVTVLCMLVMGATLDIQSRKFFWLTLGLQAACVHVEAIRTARPAPARDGEPPARIVGNSAP